MDVPIFQIVSAQQDDLGEVAAFLQPFVDQQLLLERTSLALQLLLRHSFKAVPSPDAVLPEGSDAIPSIIGFCALEIYSKKLAEVQCLAVDPAYRRLGIGKSLVAACVERARDERVLELMAISNSEAMFHACGFDYSLPNQKRAFFISP